MLVCEEVCVWEPVDGFPEEEGSLRALLDVQNCMMGEFVQKGEARSVESGTNECAEAGDGR